MNIAFVNYAAEWGGGEGWTLRTALGLKSIGHNILAIGRNKTPFTTKCGENGLTTHKMAISFDYNPNSILKLVSLLKKYKIDVLVVHHNKDVRLAGVAGRVLGIPVLHRNGFPVIHNNSRHRFTSLFTDRIITNSSRIKDHYRTFSWLKDKPIDVVPNGIHIPEGKNKTGRKEFWSNNQAVINGQRDLIALFSGRLTKVKQVDILINAIAKLDASSRWKLAIIGDGGQREELEKQVAFFGLENKVVFLGFRSDSIELPAYADLVVLPSRDEGMPNSLMEAMAHTTPVAASPAGDVEYLLDNGNAGWVMAENNPEKWAELFNMLENKKDLLKEYGVKGFKRISEHFSYEKMVAGVENSLKLTIKAKKH